MLVNEIEMVKMLESDVADEMAMYISPMAVGYRHKLDKITFDCRWFRPKWTRRENWLLFGIYKRFHSKFQYEYQIGIFGFSVRIIMKLEPHEL
jgi:hypothetical protein